MAEQTNDELQRELDATYQGVYNYKDGVFEMRYPCKITKPYERDPTYSCVEILFPEKYGDVYYIYIPGDVYALMNECDDYAILSREYKVNIHRIYTKETFEQIFPSAMQNLIKNYMVIDKNRSHTYRNDSIADSLTPLDESIPMDGCQKWLLKRICHRWVDFMRDSHYVRVRDVEREKEMHDAKVQAWLKEKEMHDAKVQAWLKEKETHDAKVQAWLKEKETHDAKVQAWLNSSQTLY